MDKAFGVVAEFNPFHNGHNALIHMARREGFTHCAAVMSGNFMQRAQPAVAEKRVRTLAALRGGVDLVLELPVAYATSSARRFAWGAVSLLQSSGSINTLCFGSEAGELDNLERLASVMDSPRMDHAMRRFLDTGLTFAKARELAAGEVLGPDSARLLAQPNNLLGVEYLRAKRELSWNARAITFPRVGVDHDSDKTWGKFASASMLRSMSDNPIFMAPYMPEEAWDALKAARKEGLFPADAAKLETAILSHLRRLSQEQLRTLPDLSEGIEDRLYAAIRQAVTLEDVYDGVKTKRYTHSRVRRLVLSAFLGLTESDVTAPPPYIRVLGFNRRGRELLSEMKALASLPIHQSLARLEGLSPACRRFASLEALSTDLYTLSLPKPRPCGYDYTAEGVFLDD
ncbi:MAG: nucleotidyltransferase family protein [Oscillospiraceae bacterium]